MMKDDILVAIEQIKRGGIVILVDHEHRENEGDFVQAAELASLDSVNFMITHGRGLLCQTITKETAKKLQLDMQVQHNTSLHTTAFTVSVDALQGTTTGISVFDRVKTIHCVASDTSVPEDLGRPGHIFPIIADEGGVLSRAGHTEGSIALVRWAGKKPSGIICEILDEEGYAANNQVLYAISKKFNIPIISIDAIIDYLKKQKQGEIDENN